ncbi:MAG: mechanosensitive ion channel family protein [Bacillota bacterium]
MDYSIFYKELFNNIILNYIFAFIIIISGIITGKYLFPFFIKKVVKILDKKSSIIESDLAKTVQKKVIPLFYFLVIKTSLNYITFSEKIYKYVDYTILILTFFFITYLIQSLTVYILKKYWKQTSMENAERTKVLYLSLFFVKVLIWMLAFIFLLDNLNIQLTGLLAGLGISGIAIGFAAQSILTDIFSYFTIFLDRPFDIGDFITVGENRGTVEYIGLKTTRIRSLGGEQLIISNTELMNSRINNYKRMERRRINFSFGVVYGTELEKLEKIPEIVKKIINKTEKTEFDRAHFASYENFSLLFQVVYYVLSNDYKEYMDIQEKINLQLKKKFKEESINFAYPTQTIYVQETKPAEEKLTSTEEVTE